jgi:hypothetical protein
MLSGNLGELICRGLK